MNHWCVQLIWTCSQWLRVLWNSTGHVRNPKGGQVSLQPTFLSIGYPRLWLVLTHSRPMEAQMATNTILTGCWQFWREICQSGACIISRHELKKVSHPQNGLGRHPLLHGYPEMGLQLPHFHLEHSRIYKYGIIKILTSWALQTSTCSLPMG